MKTIGSIVHTAPVTVGEGTPVAEVGELLTAGAVAAVVVVDGAGALCGMVTPTDLLRAGEHFTAADAMSGVVSIPATASVEAAAALAARENASHVVVTTERGQLAGLVTALELLRERDPQAATPTTSDAT